MSTIKNYKELRAALSPKLDYNLFKKNRMLGLIAFFAFLLYWLLFAIGYHYPITIIVIAIILGCISEFLSMVCHDVLHGSVFKSKNFSVLFCIPISLLTMISPSFWKFWHNFHHSSVDRWTTSARPYEMGYETFGYPKIRKYAGFLELFFFKAFHLNYTQMKFLLDKRYKSSAHLAVKKATLIQYTLIIAFKIYLFWALPFVIWLGLELVPLLIQNFLSSIFLVTQHSYKLEKGETIRTFSVGMPRWIEIFTLNNGYHVEHHLLPNLPSKHLPTLRKILENDFQQFPQDKFSMMEALKIIYKK